MSRFDLDAREPFEANADRVNPAFPMRATLSSEAKVAEPPPSDWPLIPWSRGPLSTAVIDALQRAPGSFRMSGRVEVHDALRDDDFQLALYLSYEVRHRDFSGADWEWDADLLAFRGQLEQVFVARLREEVTRRYPRQTPEVDEAIDHVIFTSTARSLLQHFVAAGDVDQLRELFVHRSASYSHDGRSEHDYRRPRGDGSAPPDAFAATLIALGLDPSLGSYVEMMPGVTLAMANLHSMFEVHHRWRGALIGQLAVQEMTAGGRTEKWGDALDRFGVVHSSTGHPSGDANFDARYAALARDHLVSGLLGADPELEGDVLFGAEATLMLDQNFCDHLLSAWTHRRSSLVPWEFNT